jgi:glucose dehydrogenase
MKRAMILLAAVMAAGTAGVVMTGPVVEAKKSAESQDQSSRIKKGMTLEEAEQIANAQATPVGAANNGVQQYRLIVKQSTSDGGTNDHPTITVYTLGVKDGKITWVHKQK